MTLIQRFGSALNLNVHFHMLWHDGAYEEGDESPPRKPRLRRTRAPTSAQLTQLADTIALRVCRHLAKCGWLEGDDEPAFLSERAAGNDGMDALLGSSMPRKRTECPPYGSVSYSAITGRSWPVADQSAFGKL